MILPSNTSYRKLFLWGLLVQLIAAWFSVGYNHCDEHFQVLEFCNYKLGLSSASDLPWEFAAHCRSAWQPFVAWCICKTLMGFGGYNPFWVSFLLRLLTGLCTWLLTCRIVKLMLPQFQTEQGRHIYVWCSFLLWFVPYIGVRFSAENVAGLLFFAGLSWLPGLLGPTPARRSPGLIIAGLFFGVALFIRLQMAFAFVGLGLWLLIYAKWSVRDWSILLFAALLAMGLSVVVDYWFYGQWVLTPLDYYKVNIIQHIAAQFGVYPWWYYFSLLLDNVVPPLSYIMLPLFIVGLSKNPRHIFTWVCIAFVAGHSAIGHKEMRFLLPVLFAFVFLASRGLDMLMSRYPGKKVYGWPLKLFAIMNIALLTVKILIPAHEAFRYYKVIYNYAQKQPTTLVCFNESPYHLIGLEVNFCKPPNTAIEIINTPLQLDSILRNAHGRAVIFLNPKMDPIPIISARPKQLVYFLLPNWARLFNFNNWMSRSYLWSIYRLN